MKEGYWLWDEDEQDYILVPYEELDPDVLEKLKTKPAIGGFVYQAEDFLHLPLVPAPFYVGNGWLPRQGKTLIFAPAKSGKSYLAIQLARCIGSGEDFLGLSTTQAVVLYLQFEMGMEILQGRMRDTKQNYDNVFVGTTFAMKLDKKEGQDVMWRAVEAVNRLRAPEQGMVVILDPKIKLVSGDENTSHDTSIITDYLDKVIEAFDCSIVIFDHTGWNTQHNRGSSSLEGWVDANISIKKVSKKGEPLRVRVTPQVMRHAQAPPDGILAELGETFEFETVEAVDEFAPTIYEKILEYIKKERIVYAKEIEKQKFGSRSQVSRALNQLLEAGMIARTARGIYEWVDKT